MAVRALADRGGAGNGAGCHWHGAQGRECFIRAICGSCHIGSHTAEMVGRIVIQPGKVGIHRCGHIACNNTRGCPDGIAISGGQSPLKSHGGVLVIGIDSPVQGGGEVINVGSRFRSYRWRVGTCGEGHIHTIGRSLAILTHHPVMIGLTRY